jgi:LCP family protein required for cell wall assembly
MLDPLESTRPCRPNRPSGDRQHCIGISNPHTVRPVRSLLAGLLGLGLPGAGHFLAGRRVAAVVFVAPVVVLVGAVLGLLLGGGVTGLLAVAVAPGVLPMLAVLNVALAVWRIAAGIDAARGAPRTVPVFGALMLGIVVLIGVPHLVAGRFIASTNDFLDTMFAGDQTAAAAPTPGGSDEPEVTMPPSPSPGYNPPRWEDEGAEKRWIVDPTAAPTPQPTKTPLGPYGGGGGAANLPPLGAAVPWQRAGAVPWGDDGRFDLLLLGSDAGSDRWSRRMDTMLLVEIDVASGKVAMIGLPRSLYNAPFPPGPARDAVACGCLKGLLNEMYVEATFRHPDRWPGTGAVKGIGAVRSVVSEITGRPIDGVLVVDLMGVIRVVDALGGVDITVPARVHDDRYPDPIYGSIVLDIPAGTQHMDGRIALAYARSRHQDSDYQRMARQQVMVLAIRRQIGPATILGAPDLFAAAKGAAWTDLPRSSLPALVELFDKAAKSSVKQLRIVPPTYSTFLTAAELSRIRHDVANLLGPVPAPTPTPVPTASPPASTAPSPSEAPPPPSESPAAPTPGPSPPPPAST